MTDELKAALIFIFLIYPILVQGLVILKIYKYLDKKELILWLIPYFIYYTLIRMLIEDY